MTGKRHLLTYIFPIDIKERLDFCDKGMGRSYLFNVSLIKSYDYIFVLFWELL